MQYGIDDGLPECDQRYLVAVDTVQLSVVHLEIAEDAVGYEIGRAVDLIEQVVGQIPALVHEYRIVPMEADAVDGRIREWVLGQESVCAGGLVSMRDVYQDPCIYQGAYLRS